MIAGVLHALVWLTIAFPVRGEELVLGGKFLFSWNDASSPATSLNILHVTGQNLPLWTTYAKYPFLRLGNASLPRAPIQDGNYQLQEKVEYLSDITTIDSVQAGKGEMSVTISGRLLATTNDNVKKNPELVASYEMYFTIAATTELQFTIDVKPNADLFMTDKGTTLTNPRTFITYGCEKDENFYGFGESFTFFNLKGHNVPILVSEQGVGRGDQPITDTLNFGQQGVGGGWYTTYAPKPIYITNHNRTVMLNNSEVSFFNLTHTDGTDSAPRVQIEVWSLRTVGYLMKSPTLLTAVEAVTAITGRMQGLPEWTQLGAIVGLEGGTTNVTEIVDRMYAGSPGGQVNF